MKLCKDCKHFDRSWFFTATYSKCTRKNKQVTDAITGKIRNHKHVLFCDDERDMLGSYPSLTASRGQCGPEAIYWEEK